MTDASDGQVPGSARLSDVSDRARSSGARKPVTVTVPLSIRQTSKAGPSLLDGLRQARHQLQQLHKHILDKVR